MRSYYYGVPVSLFVMVMQIKSLAPDERDNVGLQERVIRIACIPRDFCP